MTEDPAQAELDYAAWRWARLAAFMVVPVGVLSILGAGILGVEGSRLGSPGVMAGAVVYALAHCGVVAAGILVHRARGAFELIHRRLAWMAASAGVGLAAAATCGTWLAVVTVGAPFAEAARIAYALPSLPPLLALASAGFVLLAFGRRWRESEGEMREG